MNTLLNWDAQIFQSINQYAGSWLDYFLGWPTFLGQAYFYLPLTFLFMLIWDKPEKIPKHFLMIILCASLAGIFNHALKEVIQRPRPYTYFYEAIDQGRVIIIYSKMKLPNHFLPDIPQACSAWPMPCTAFMAINFV